MDLKDKIKELRIENCLTQEQLAEKLNVSRQTVSKYELGINEPDIDTLKKLCIIFDVDIGTLIEVSGKDKKTIRIEKANSIIFKIIISLCIYLIFTSFIFLRFLPNEIPIHFDINLVPDRTGSKYELLLLSSIGIIPIILLLVFQFLGNKELFENFRTHKLILYSILLIVELGYLIFMIFFSFYALKDTSLYIGNIISSLIGGLALILAFSSSPLFNKKVNPFFGYRTKFSLSNVIYWKKLNLCQSISAGIAGLLMIILGLTLITEYSFIYIFFLILSIIPTFIYEIILKRKAKKEEVIK